MTLPGPAPSEAVPPPLRPPFHFDAILGEDHPLTPADTLYALVLRLSTVLELDGPWIVGGWEVALLAQHRGEYGAPFEADFRACHGGGPAVDVALRIAVHPSGWLEARLTLGDGRGASIFIERLYEEFDLWPPGSPCTAVDSGRMGKRASWVQLEAEHWPDFAALAEGRFITLEARDRDR